MTSCTALLIGSEIESNMIAFIATAGSGKTESLVTKAKQRPSGVALTYTRRMARELDRRMPSGVKCMTFHSLAGQVFSRVYGRPLPKLPDDYYILPAEDRRVAYTESVSDAIIACVTAIGEDPMILKEWAAFQGYHSLFVDEAQDLSEDLWMFVCKLVDAGLDLYIAGDPNQSIYGFLGGSASYMRDLVQRYSLEVQELNINYRSTTSIVDVANALTGLESTAFREDVGMEVEFARLMSNSDIEWYFSTRGGKLIGYQVISPWKYSLSRTFDSPTRRLLDIRTIHSVKGEEFNDVVLLVDGPGLDRVGSSEEGVRNLMYVGVTRAVNSLRVIQLGDVRWRVLDSMLEFLSSRYGTQSQMFTE